MNKIGGEDMKNKVKQIIEAHKFFIRETPRLIGKPKYGWLNDFVLSNSTSDQLKDDIKNHYKLTFKQKLYYPVAYLKFMYYTLKNPSNKV